MWGIIFWRGGKVLLPPFAGREAETFFKHGVEKSQMPVAAFVGDVDNLGIGIRQQLARALEAQLNLARAQRHAEFLTEQTAEMTFAAMEMAGQIGQELAGGRRVGVEELVDQKDAPRGALLI